MLFFERKGINVCSVVSEFVMELVDSYYSY